MCERTKCERYTRIAGYFRPVDSWNEGKRSEFNDRKMFNVKEEDIMACGKGKHKGKKK